nr:MAG TPA: hypothetical protein [Caudoviricetes sp.]
MPTVFSSYSSFVKSMPSITSYLILLASLY